MTDSLFKCKILLKATIAAPEIKKNETFRFSNECKIKYHLSKTSESFRATLLTDDMKKRLNLCEKYLNWTGKYWKK